MKMLERKSGQTFFAIRNCLRCLQQRCTLLCCCFIVKAFLTQLTWKVYFEQKWQKYVYINMPYGSCKLGRLERCNLIYKLQSVLYSIYCIEIKTLAIINVNLTHKNNYLLYAYWRIILIIFIASHTVKLIIDLDNF
jgi:hypothetical protein